jgi:exonuclease III
MGVQEIKAQAGDTGERFATIAGLQGYFHFSQRKGCR